MPWEFERNYDNGRYHRTRPANSRRHRYPVHRPLSSVWNDRDVLHLAHGCRGGSPSRPPSREAIAQLGDPTARPISAAGHETTEQAFVLAARPILDSASPRMAFLEPEQSYPYDNWSLPYLAFDELDRKLFRSKLRGNVCLKWSMIPYGIPGRTSRAGLEYPRITIELSDILPNTTKIGVLTALLHQMIHAYFLQCCGYQSEGQGRSGYGLGHDFEFLAFKDLISRKYSSVLPRRKSSVPFSWNPLDNPRLPGRGREHSSLIRSQPGCSNCHQKDSPLWEEDILHLASWIQHAASLFPQEPTTPIQDAGNKIIGYSQASKEYGSTNGLRYGNRG